MFEEIGKAIADAFAELVALIDEVLGTLIEITVSVFKHVLNIAYQKLYGIYLHFRKLLAASGFAFPVRSMLTEQRFGHLTDPGRYPDATGRQISDPSVQEAYPTMTLPRIEIGGTEIPFLKAESHLIYPPEQEPRAVEQPDQNSTDSTAAVIPGPRIYTQKQADYYMWDANTPDSLALKKLFDIGDELRNREHNDVAGYWEQLSRQANELSQDSLLGNATDLTVEFVRSAVEGLTLPNLNLDGDRGMAFPSWLMSPDWYRAVQSGQMPNPNDVGTVNIQPDTVIMPT